jgi:protoheme IX farnesyltransferase
MILSVLDHHTIDLSAPRISEAGVADYIALLKPRVMSLVVFTAMVGYFLAPGDHHPVLAITSILCIAVGGGASGALNMWYEADIDALMSRTANRPIPRGRITRPEALTFGLVLAFFSVMTLGILVNWLAGALLAFTIFFYVVIYTIALKRWTAQNIVIGGAAGALPPVVAWAAASGTLSMEPVLLFLIIFFWTPPHFWALALFRNDDYTRAGVPMLPVVAGPDATRLQISALHRRAGRDRRGPVAARLFLCHLRHGFADPRRRHDVSRRRGLSSARRHACQSRDAQAVCFLDRLSVRAVCHSVARGGREGHPPDGLVEGRMIRWTMSASLPSQRASSLPRHRRRAGANARWPSPGRSASSSCCSLPSPWSKGRPFSSGPCNDRS